MTPQFKDLSGFFDMGGNAAFVFGAWGLSLAVIFVLIGRAIVIGRRQKARLTALEADRRS